MTKEDLKTLLQNANYTEGYTIDEINMTFYLDNREGHYYFGANVYHANICIAAIFELDYDTVKEMIEEIKYLQPTISVYYDIVAK